MNGKGDKPRPYSVSMETFDDNFERIFGKRDTGKKLLEKDDKKDNADEEKGSSLQDDSL